MTRDYSRNAQAIRRISMTRPAGLLSGFSAAPAFHPCATDRMRHPLALLAALGLSAAIPAQQPFDFLPPEVHTSANFALGVTEADLNGDEVPDLLVVSHCPPRAVCLFNDCEGGFFWAGDIPLPVASKASDVVTGDFDNDGRDDFAIVMIALDRIDLYHNQGGGAFALGASLATGRGPRGLDAGDYDNDGDTDLAVAVAFADRAEVFENLGGGSFAAGAALAAGAGSEPHDVAFGDYDDDGDLDLAISSLSGGAVELFHYGAGAFAHAQSLAMNPAVASVRGLDAGDLDNDGDDDLAAASNGPAGAYASVMLASGGLLGAPAEYPSGGFGAEEIAVADFDGDGLADLAVANAKSSSLGMFANLGAGAFGAVQVEGTGDLPVNLAVADFDANQRPDVAAACAATATNTHLNRTGAMVLSQTGACPGVVTVDLSGATPNSTVEVWSAGGCGRWALPPGHPCAGLVTGLDGSAALAGTLVIGPAGGGSSTVNLPAGACGRPIQAVDPVACQTSNVWLLK